MLCFYIKKLFLIFIEDDKGFTNYLGLLLMKTYSIEEVQDKLIGEVGTPERNRFEYELKMDLIGKAIKQTRQERNLTQEELGKLIGVQKAQISRIENNASNVTMDTLIRVFTALKAKVKFQVELPNLNISIGE